MTISGGRNKQLDIFCRVTGFTSDFLSFIVVELIRFLHGVTELFNRLLLITHPTTTKHLVTSRRYLVKFS